MKLQTRNETNEMQQYYMEIVKMNTKVANIIMQIVTQYHSANLLNKWVKIFKTIDYHYILILKRTGILYIVAKFNVLQNV